MHVDICFSNYSYQAAGGLLIDDSDKLWPHNLLLCISRCKFHSNNSFSHANKSVCRKTTLSAICCCQKCWIKRFSLFKKKNEQNAFKSISKNVWMSRVKLLFICPYSSACVLNSMTGGWSRISSLLSTESFVKPDPNKTNRLFRAWDMKLLLDDKVVIGERTVQSHVNTTDKA